MLYWNLVIFESLMQLTTHEYKATLKSIHTEAVSSAISRLGNNPVLNTPPPEISQSEKRLNRMQRTTLAQLRSGHCKLIREYAVRIGISRSAICPECLIRRHTLSHIFQCDAAPTNLTFIDLWQNPVCVTNFLQSLRAFPSLRPPDPPPAPRPPPEPPP